MTGERDSWRSGQATRANEAPAAAAHSAAAHPLATQSHGAERFDSSTPASPRANFRGTK
jgi:hypothetical protein